MGLLLAWEIPLTGGGRPGEDALSSTSHLGLGGLDAAGPQVARRFLAEPHGQAGSLLLLRLEPPLTNGDKAWVSFGGHLTPKGLGEDAPGAGPTRSIWSKPGASVGAEEGAHSAWPCLSFPARESGRKAAELPLGCP